MKRYFIFISVCFLLGVSYFISSCANDKVCTDCTPLPSKKVTLDLLLSSKFSQKLPIKYWLATKQRDYPDYSIGSAMENEDAFKNCTDYIKQQSINLKDEIVSITLYISKTIDGTSSINEHDVVGFSLYTFKKNNFKHQLFQKSNNKFLEVKSKQFYVDDIYHNDLAEILNELVIKGKQEKSYLIISGDSRDKIANERNTKVSNLEAINKSGREGGGMGCLSPCPYRSGICGDGGVCRTAGEILCPSLSFSNTLLSENYLVESSKIDIDLLYRFRDEFLSNHTVGIEYIEMYDDLGYFLSGKVSLQLMIKTANVLGNSNIIMEKLLNPSLYGNNIAIIASNRMGAIHIVLF